MFLLRTVRIQAQPHAIAVTSDRGTENSDAGGSQTRLTGAAQVELLTGEVANASECRLFNPTSFLLGDNLIDRCHQKINLHASSSSVSFEQDLPDWPILNSWPHLPICD
jgi:hypothetical protein